MDTEDNGKSGSADIRVYVNGNDIRFYPMGFSGTPTSVDIQGEGVAHLKINYRDYLRPGKYEITDFGIEFADGVGRVFDRPTKGTILVDVDDDRVTHKGVLSDVEVAGNAGGDRKATMSGNYTIVVNIP